MAEYKESEPILEDGHTHTEKIEGFLAAIYDSTVTLDMSDTFNMPGNE